MPVQYLPFFGGGTLGLYSIATGEPLLTTVAGQATLFAM